MKLLSSLLVLSKGTHGSPELCMVDYDDRLPCSIDRPLSYFECTTIGCCYDSNVPDDVPRCYFRNAISSEPDLSAEESAEPIWVTAGSYKSSNDNGSKSGDVQIRDDVTLEPVDGPVLTMEELDKLMASGKTLEISGPVDNERSCEIPTEYDRSKLKRCGRRGVPRRRCEELDCCWNPQWRPKGKNGLIAPFGPRCFEWNIDLEHYGKPREREFTNMNRFGPKSPVLDQVPDDDVFVDTTLNALEKKKEELEKAIEGCQPNHNQLQCIQGPEERQRCNIKAELTAGMKPCDACLFKGCCFDPMPRIVGNSIMPLCFHHGPLADFNEDFGILPTEAIPEATPDIPSTFFDGKPPLVPSTNIIDEEPAHIPGPPQFGPKLPGQGPKPPKSEPVTSEMGIERPHSEGHGGIINFGQPDLGQNDDHFQKMTNAIEMLREHEFNELPLQPNQSMGKEMVQILLQKRPEFAQFYNQDGTLKSESAQSPAELSAEEQLAEKLRQAKEMYKNPRKPGSPGLPPRTTQESITVRSTVEPKFEPQSPTKSGTLTSIFSGQEPDQYTKPNIELTHLYPAYPTEKPKILLPGEIEQAKREKIDFLLQTFSKIYQRQGYSGAELDLQLSKKRTELEESYGIMTPRQVVTTTTRPVTTTTASTTSTTIEPTTTSSWETKLPFITPAYDPSTPRTCYPQECGQPTIKNRALVKIVGGQWAGSAQYWPWQASLRRSVGEEPKFHHFCGATVISDKWILTAAHCFIRANEKYGLDKRYMEFEIDRFLVHFGRYTISQPEASAQVRSLDHFVQHPEYQPWGNQEHDIAVAKLAGKPLKFTDYVKPVCLPTFVPPVGDKLMITGWGSTQDVGPGKEKLKEIPLPLTSQKICAEQWGKYFNDGWMCTDPGYLEDACKGDSGGPAVHYDSFSDKFSIVGVTIAGSRTCSTSVSTIRAGVYSNVLYYKKWINDVTGYGCM